MNEKNTQGVAGLKKYDIKTINIVFMIYCLVAAGAFGIEEMVSSSGPGITLLLLITFPLIWAWPISNLVAEAGSILPSEGGVYVWVREAFGEFWGFQAGWWATISTYITNGVYVALVVDYTSQYIALSPSMKMGIKVFMILLFTLINLLGIREVGKVSSLLSVLILIAFGAVTIVGLLNWNYNPIEPFVGEDLTILEGIGGGIGICIWMYCGYECISNMAGEVKNPQVIPKGLLIAMPLIALTYVLPTLAGLASVGNYASWSTTGDGVGYSSVLTQNLGQAWGYVFLFIAIISQCAIFNTYLASGSRGFFVLADDNLCPQFLIKVSQKRGVPYIGILSLAIVTLFLAQYEFKTLVMAEVVFMMALYMILPLAVIKLRKKIPLNERGESYIMPGGTVGLYIFALLPLIISIIALFISGIDYFIIGLLGTSTGPIFYLLCKYNYGGLSKNNPKKYPLNPKTRLAFGDTLRLSLYSAIIAIFALLGTVFFNWYERDVDVIEFAEEAESSIFSNLWGMIDFLKYLGIIMAVVAIILFVFSKKVEPNDKIEENTGV